MESRRHVVTLHRFNWQKGRQGYLRFDGSDQFMWISEDLIVQWDLHDGDQLVFLSTRPIGEPLNWSQMAKHKAEGRRLHVGAGDSHQYSFEFMISELRHYINGITDHLSNAYLYTILVIPYKESEVTNTEAWLRAKCKVPDTCGFGRALRGILTGKSDFATASQDMNTISRFEWIRDSTRQEMHQLNIDMCSPTLSMAESDILMGRYQSLSKYLTQIEGQIFDYYWENHHQLVEPEPVPEPAVHRFQTTPGLSEDAIVVDWWGEKTDDFVRKTLTKKEFLKDFGWE